jgi:hypothetical protein
VSLQSFVRMLLKTGTSKWEKNVNNDYILNYMWRWQWHNGRENSRKAETYIKDEWRRFSKLPRIVEIECEDDAAMVYNIRSTIILTELAACQLLLVSLVLLQCFSKSSLLLTEPVEMKKSKILPYICIIRRKYINCINKGLEGADF